MEKPSGRVKANSRRYMHSVSIWGCAQRRAVIAPEWQCCAAATVQCAQQRLGLAEQMKQVELVASIAGD